MNNANFTDEEIARISKEILDVQKSKNKKRSYEKLLKRDRRKDNKKSGKEYGVNFFNKKDR